MKTAIYPGSFNPWTKGHQDILDRALTIFDEITIVVAANDKKSVNKHFICDTLVPVVDKYNGRVKVSCTDGLISSFNSTIIRGVRSGDWEYEQNMAMWNKKLGVETVFLCTQPHNSFINSSALRLLNEQQVDIRKFAGNKKSIELWLTRS